MQVGVVALMTWPVQSRSPREGYCQSIELAQMAEQLGFESVWAIDHVHHWDDPQTNDMLEPFILLTSIAAATQRVRIGTMVLSGGFRNPALTAKMAGVLDVASNGRFELGIGSGWMESEWRAYGYGFPSASDRIGALGDQVEIICGMLGTGPTTFHGRFASVDGAVAVPRGLQEPRIPIVVGGNGRNVARRIAARYADELNLVFLAPEKIPEELEITRRVCEEVGRDPDSLRVSVYALDADMQRTGRERIEILEAYARLGITRFVGNLHLQNGGLADLESFAADCRATSSVTLAA
jgi:alkanesulfonate monooxygenase SsuD/methylene tetrahydromethanopterin reductase-like flavin-dependent oxidoreductase (luciferase family)